MMKRKNKHYLFCLLMAFVPGMFFSSVAHADFHDLSTIANSSYVGFDVGLKHTGVKHGHCRDTHKSSHKMGKYNFATEIAPNLDVEIYHERNIGSSKKLSKGGHGTTKFSNAGIGLIYKLDVSGVNNMKPFVGVGLKNVRVKMDHNQVVDAYLTSSKVLWKLNGGVEFMLNDNVGTRATASFENSSRLKPSANGNTAKLKNSFGVHTGFFARIC